jgi:CRISPR-associated endonuclease/helicase Cas3
MELSGQQQGLWAKRSPLTDLECAEYHLLACHLADVATVVSTLWESSFSKALIQEVASFMSTNVPEAGKQVAFLAALHDIGKASPVFQSMISQGNTERLECVGLLVKKPLPKGIYHGDITAAVTPEILRALDLSSTADGIEVAGIIGGHHGIFPDSPAVMQASNPVVCGGAEWAMARIELAKLLRDILGITRLTMPVKPNNTFGMLLAGIVCAADWIGSAEQYFPYATGPLDLTTYFKESQERARQAIGAINWLAPTRKSAARTIKQLFPWMTVPRDLHVKVEEVARGIDAPSLAIVEAPTGEGKTEAALFLAEHCASRLGQSGFYFALPTQATSNQMFSRVLGFLRDSLSEGQLEAANIALLHGSASLSAELAQLRSKERDLAPSSIYEDGKDDITADVRAGEWFSYRKRGLLSPFGVGTVDQALMATLRTKHVFLRLMGLGGKVVVFDEVHAYDAYMQTILQRLLEWLGAMECSVVMLSATLPSAQREALVRAYLAGVGAADEMSVPDTNYPRILVANKHKVEAKPLETWSGNHRSVKVVWLDPDDPEHAEAHFELGERLASTLQGGGCAAVVCNTVRHAQQMFERLRRYFPGVDAVDGWPELMLLHSRFPFGERRERELRTLIRFGALGAVVTLENGERVETCRPHKAILVATQIIEQSLDIDFDLMVSDLAPIDLDLQRSGRLHRHQRERPADLKDPELWLFAPLVDDQGSPHFPRGSLHVYSPHVLLRTWYALRGREFIRTPQDIEGLVEHVYGEAVPPPDASEGERREWEKTWGEQAEKLSHMQEEARNRCLKSPRDEGSHIWEYLRNSKSEDSPDVLPQFQALTRLTGPTIEAVCLFEQDGLLFLDEARTRSIDLDLPPDRAMIVELLMRSVSISLPPLVSELSAQPVPGGWAKSSILCRKKVLPFKAETGGGFSGELYRKDSIYLVRLDPELGIMVEKS